MDKLINDSVKLLDKFGGSMSTIEDYQIIAAATGTEALEQT